MRLKSGVWDWNPGYEVVEIHGSDGFNDYLLWRLYYDVTLWRLYYDVSTMTSRYDVSTMTSLWRLYYDVSSMTSQLWRLYYDVSTMTSLLWRHCQSPTPLLISLLWHHYYLYYTFIVFYYAVTILSTMPNPAIMTLPTSPLWRSRHYNVTNHVTLTLLTSNFMTSSPIPATMASLTPILWRH